MSHVIIPGDRTKVQGPWQLKCHYCESMIELTVDALKTCRNGSWWDCPGCGVNHSWTTVTGKREGNPFTV